MLGDLKNREDSVVAVVIYSKERQKAFPLGQFNSIKVRLFVVRVFFGSLAHK